MDPSSLTKANISEALLKPCVLLFLASVQICSRGGHQASRKHDAVHTLFFGYMFLYMWNNFSESKSRSQIHIASTEVYLRWQRWIAQSMKKLLTPKKSTKKTSTTKEFSKNPENLHMKSPHFSHNQCRSNFFSNLRFLICAYFLLFSFHLPQGPRCRKTMEDAECIRFLLVYLVWLYKETVIHSHGCHGYKSESEPRNNWRKGVTYCDMLPSVNEDLRSWLKKPMICQT